MLYRIVLPPLKKKVEEKPEAKEETSRDMSWVESN